MVAPYPLLLLFCSHPEYIAQCMAWLKGYPSRPALAAVAAGVISNICHNIKAAREEVFTGGNMEVVMDMLAGGVRDFGGGEVGRGGCTREGRGGG